MQAQGHVHHFHRRPPPPAQGRSAAGGFPQGVEAAPLPGAGTEGAPGGGGGAAVQLAGAV